MSWLWIVPLMFGLMLLNMRIFLAMFAATLVYFVFFNTLPIGISVQRLVAPALNSTLLVLPFFILLFTLISHAVFVPVILHLAIYMIIRLRRVITVYNDMICIVHLL